MTALQDALYQARTGAVVGHEMRPCALCLVIQHVEEDEERVALEQAAAGRISGRALHTALRSIGVGVGRDVIRRHRNEAHRP